MSEKKQFNDEELYSGMSAKELEEATKAFLAEHADELPPEDEAAEDAAAPAVEEKAGEDKSAKAKKSGKAAAKTPEEQLENLKETLSAEYVEPVFSFTKTAYGTDVIVIEENGDCSYDYVEYVTIYEGYFISLGILTDTPITEAEMETALTLLSDMWIVPVN